MIKGELKEIEKIIYEFIYERMRSNIIMYKNIYLSPVGGVNIYLTNSTNDNNIVPTITISKGKDTLIITKTEDGELLVVNNGNIDINILNQIKDMQNKLRIDKNKTYKRSNILPTYLNRYDSMRFIHTSDKLGISHIKSLYPTIKKTVDFWTDVITMYIKDISYSEIEGFRNKLTIILRDELLKGNSVCLNYHKHNLMNDISNRNDILMLLLKDRYQELGNNINLSTDYNFNPQTITSVYECNLVGIEKYNIQDFDKGYINRAAMETVDYWMYKAIRSTNLEDIEKIITIRETLYNIIRERLSNNIVYISDSKIAYILEDTDFLLRGLCHEIKIKAKNFTEKTDSHDEDYSITTKKEVSIYKLKSKVRTKNTIKFY